MPRDSRTYIFVPFADRDEAKGLGAKWDKDKKQWFVPSGLDFTLFAKWEHKYTYEINADEALRQFSEKLRECGLLLESMPIMDGKIHRCKVEGDRGREMSGSYQGYLDGYPNGWVHNFKTDERVKFKYAMTASYSPSTTTYNRDKVMEQHKANTQAKERHQRELQEKTTKRLKIEFANALPARDSHPYLESKNISIQNINIKVDTFNNLLIPLRDVNGKVQSLQRIMPNGSKMYGVIKTAQERQNNEEFLARKNGLFFTQKPLDEHSEFFVCEGFASAMSMSKILNKPSIAAMDCGNLLNVCDELVSKYPHKHITICADNDMKKEVQGKRNAGMEAARACQEKYPQIRIIYPQIQPSEIERVSDFNDLVNLRGIEAVRAEVEEQIEALTTLRDIKFFDKQKQEHILTKEVQQQWLETFSLKSLNESYTPQIPQSVMDKISKITITYKDLEKLVEKGREKYMGEILPTFKNPQVVFKDMQGDVIFAREMNDKLFFVNVTRDYGDDGFLSVTQSPKKENTLFNKLANPQEVYLVEETLVSKLRDSSAHKAFTDFLSAANKTSGETIPQIHKLKNKKDDFER